MNSYQSIELRIKEVAENVSKLAFMNKEQIFDVIAEIVAISDEINTFIRQIDLDVAQAEIEVIEEQSGKKVSASMLEQLMKPKTATLKADKKWAERQISLLSEMRMAALAASRTVE